MAYVLKGNPLAILTQIFPTYHAETKTYTFSYEYKGTEGAIRGLESQLRARGTSYRITHDGPVYTLNSDTPVQDIDENLDRYEIQTESVEKSLFELPAVVAAADAYDALPGSSDAKTFREECEDAARTNSGFQSGDPLVSTLIKHLRAGVTGWQLDLVTLRRSRRLETYITPSYRLNLDAGLYIYTSGQLGLPANVAFALPTAPTTNTAYDNLFMWGWRKRSQRVEIVGNFAEQVVELTFAPWSLTVYTPASSGLAW